MEGSDLQIHQAAPMLKEQQVRPRGIGAWTSSQRTGLLDQPEPEAMELSTRQRWLIGIPPLNGQPRCNNHLERQPVRIF